MAPLPRPRTARITLPTLPGVSTSSRISRKQRISKGMAFTLNLQDLTTWFGYGHHRCSAPPTAHSPSLPELGSFALTQFWEKPWCGKVTLCQRAVSKVVCWRFVSRRRCGMRQFLSRLIQPLHLNLERMKVRPSSLQIKSTSVSSARGLPHIRAVSTQPESP